MKPIPCSVAVLTYNSEKDLPGCLESLREFGEIIIADGGSTDRTLAIAREYGARVISQVVTGKPIDDFSRERNNSLQQSTYDWHFYLDADDRISDDLASIIRTVVENPNPPYVVYRTRYVLTSPDFSQRYQSFKPYYQERLFHKKTGAHFIKPMHEKITFDRGMYPVGTIEEPWLVPLDTQLRFAVYRKKVLYRLGVLASTWEPRSFVHYLRTALLGPLLEASKFLGKAVVLRLMYPWSTLVPFRYELYRTYSQFVVMYTYTQRYVRLQRESKVAADAEKHIFYLFHGRYPSDKAAGLFAAKSCEAFGDLGVGLTLLVPRRRQLELRDPYDFYTLRRTFVTQYLFTVDVFQVPVLRRIAFYVSYVVYSLVSCIYLLIYARRNDVIYSNEVLPLLLASYAFSHTVYEVHDYPETKKWLYGVLLRRAQRILVTNDWKRNRLIAEFNLPGEKLFVERNGVDIKEFTIATSKREARERLKLESDIPIVLYTGHLYSWKGAHVLAQAAELLEGIRVAFVGGTEKDIALFRGLYGRIPSIQFFGHRPHEEMPLWQKAADVLVIPNTAKEDISKFYTSPMKLFEYMASDRPIVASDIPSVREVVSDDDAFFATPDDAGALAAMIRFVLEHGGEAQQRATHARRTVEGYSWSARAGRILVQLKKLV